MSEFTKVVNVPVEEEEVAYGNAKYSKLVFTYDL